MNVLVMGGVAHNSMIYVQEFPQPIPQTVFSKGGHETVGSTGAGKAFNLAKLGLQVTLYGQIGDDWRGQNAVAFLRRQGVHFEYAIDPAGTKHHVNLMNDAGERISIYVTTGSHDAEPDLPRIRHLLEECDLVALNIINYCRKTIPLIKEMGKPIWCDIHDYDGKDPYHKDFIEAADVLFMSSAAMPDYRDFMQRIVAQGKQFVVCTHGAAGATALTADGRWTETPIIPYYKRTDTNGAGDAFFSGVMYGWQKGYPMTECLRYGTLAAGLCITSHELAYPNLSAELIESAYQQHYGENGAS